MRVLVTGASGFIGSEAARVLREGGHEVLGLARSDEAAAKLEAAGVQVQRGNIEDAAALAETTRGCDAVVHLGFNHDFSRYQQNIVDDRAALEAMSEALAGSGKPLIAAFGLAGFAGGHVVTEADAPVIGHPLAMRGATEAVLETAATRGVRAMILRLPPTVHGAGDGGFVPMLVKIARDKGASAYVDEGVNRWPAVHRTDAARLIALALEHGEPGQRLHAVAEEGVPTRDIAAAVAEGLDVPLRAVPRDEAGAWFGFLGAFFGGDLPTSSAITREKLGRTPREPGLLDNMRAHYFG